MNVQRAVKGLRPDVTFSSLPGIVVKPRPPAPVSTFLGLISYHYVLLSNNEKVSPLNSFFYSVTIEIVKYVEIS